MFMFQYFVEAGAIAVRRVRKEDLRHVAKATGATVVCFLSSNSKLNCVLVFEFSLVWFFDLLEEWIVHVELRKAYIVQLLEL